MKKTVRGIDERVSRLVARLPIVWKPFFTPITVAGNPEITFSISGVLILLGVMLESTEILYFGVIALLTLSIGTATKLSFRRNRPDTQYVSDMKLKSYSFPSGHSVGSMIIYGGFGWLSIQTIGGIFGITAAALLFAFSLVIGVSRVYLGAHYASDVVGGWTIGLIGIAAMVAAIPLV